MRTVEDHNDLSILDDVKEPATTTLWPIRAASTLVSAVLVVVLAWYGADLTWQWMSPTGTVITRTTPTQPSAQNVQNAQSERAEQLKTIIAAQLFGTPKVVEAPQEPEAPPETPLDLRLKGIVYSDVAADARAIAGAVADAGLVAVVA